MSQAGDGMNSLRNFTPDDERLIRLEPENRCVSERVKLQIPYTQQFVRRRCRNSEPVRFWEKMEVFLDTVEADAAPIAYKVSETDALAERREHGSLYAIRSFRGALWWPLVGPRGFVQPDDLRGLLAEGDEGALLAIDSSIETPLNVSELAHDAYFEQNPYRTMDISDRDDRVGLAHRGARQVMFCDGKVYVVAGEPIYYLAHTPTKGSFAVTVGAASLSRRGTTAAGIPGPTAWTRIESARRGTAYAIGEIEDEIRLQLDRGNSIFGAPKIEILCDCQLPDTAALLCARVLAEFVWGEAGREGYWTDSLRRSVPTLAASRDADAASNDLPCLEVLVQLTSCKDQAVRNEFFNEIRDARDVLRRLRSFGHGSLEEDDEAALSDWAAQLPGNIRKGPAGPCE
ncbi:hypothetical protein [Bradyrhizobium sp.]|uniref:hypothetical protein n=1 Tax=Bradyrhizobium sp. TaxID=376 RepID=UPI0027364625|nr:hypothetical protein [Bradyrhizobium sp.]MDP3074884.1 hypothetical protein [Bradyrhizobium sp.]